MFIEGIIDRILANRRSTVSDREKRYQLLDNYRWHAIRVLKVNPTPENFKEYARALHDSQQYLNRYLAPPMPQKTFL